MPALTKELEPIAYDKRRHIIVGGVGFLGRAMQSLLQRRGCATIGIARPLSEPPLLPLGYQMVWQAAEHVSWADLLLPNDVVHYYAWGSVPGTANTEPAFDLLSNVTPLIRLLESIRTTKVPVTIVFVSSGGTVYGETVDLPIAETHPLQPITAYGVGKATAEHYLGFYRGLYGIDCRVVRLANPYGPGQRSGKGQGAIAEFMSRVRQGSEIEIWGDGRVVRDYVFLDDALEGLLAACYARADRKLPVFNIGSGVGTSLNDVVAILQKISGKRLSVRYEAFRAFDVQYNVLDVTKAKRELSWEPTVSLEAGMSRTYEAMQSLNESMRK